MKSFRPLHNIMLGQKDFFNKKLSSVDPKDAALFNQAVDAVLQTASICFGAEIGINKN
ncbi:hypothetical protein SAMN05216243_0341 [Sediminibacillus albus]|uniref:Uncharacterized protein n=1 Tax=Sediminibacillus albus TaxID=407036 RepID=A0A1G8VT61_9BACI|nr:hypothetical protein SAMN05216243_0341 [Sediminibacillus albus]